MPILIKCSDPNCGKTLRVKDELAGRAVKCPGCQKPVRVPAPRPEAAAGQPEPAADPPAPGAAKSADPRESRLRESDAPAVLSLPRLVLRPKRGLKNIFNTDLDILDAETKDPVGAAGDRTKKLFGLFKVNPDMERWEVLDENGKAAFAIRITKDRKFTSGELTGIECELLDLKDRLLAAFRYKLKGVVMKGWQLSLVDENEQEFGRVSISSGKLLAGEPPRITLSSPDGGEYGTVVYKGLADAVAMAKKMKAEGKKFGAVGGFGDPGLEVAVAEGSVGEVAIHRALIALAVIVEVTKIGKEQVSLHRR